MQRFYDYKDAVVFLPVYLFHRWIAKSLTQQLVLSVCTLSFTAQGGAKTLCLQTGAAVTMLRAPQPLCNKLCLIHTTFSWLTTFLPFSYHILIIQIMIIFFLPSNMKYIHNMPRVL